MDPKQLTDDQYTTPQVDLTTTELKRIGQAYRDGLPVRLEMLERLVPAAAAGSNDALWEIITEAHKLRGTAKLFEMNRFGDAMVDIEDLLLRVSNDNFRDSAAWLRVDKALCLAKCTLTQESETDHQKTEEQ
ncbi:MAG TPA: Hpt domain-containing protein [Oculatellaceae cyanobacterium]